MAEALRDGGLAFGAHERAADGGTVEWYTPPAVLDALGLEFDLDPCSPAGGIPWIPAARFYALDAGQDGLILPWEGRVFMNPPYGPHTRLWMRRLAAHGDGVALVFARTDARWFQETVAAADALCLLAGRLSFVDRDGRPGRANAGAPSCLVAYGRVCAEAVARAALGITFAVRMDGLRGQGQLFEAATVPELGASGSSSRENSPRGEAANPAAPAGGVGHSKPPRAAGSLPARPSSASPGSRLGGQAVPLEAAA